MPVATIGDVATSRKEITHETIESYAELTGDDNPLHLDTEYANTGLFNGVVAHGMLGAGVISAAVADLPGDIIYVTQELSFEAPVRPGDTIEARAEVVEELENDRLRIATTAKTTDRDTTVITGDAIVLSLEHM